MPCPIHVFRYHESIHSPALFTLLQLEHTYGINVAELVEQRNRTRKDSVLCAVCVLDNSRVHAPCSRAAAVGGTGTELVRISNRAQPSTIEHPHPRNPPIASPQKIYILVGCSSR